MYNCEFVVLGMLGRGIILVKIFLNCIMLVLVKSKVVLLGIKGMLG